eukprot:577728-Pyramimonas_sp.AAC.1
MNPCRFQELQENGEDEKAAGKEGPDGDENEEKALGDMSSAASSAAGPASLKRISPRQIPFYRSLSGLPPMKKYPGKATEQR